MATSWKSQQGDGMYSLQFETDDIDKYRLVEKAAQMAVDGNTTADVVEVKHARWVQTSALVNPYCSDCKCYNDRQTTFCSCCGAKMDGGKKE